MKISMDCEKSKNKINSIETKKRKSVTLSVTNDRALRFNKRKGHKKVAWANNHVKAKKLRLLLKDEYNSGQKTQTTKAISAKEEKKIYRS